MTEQPNPFRDRLNLLVPISKLTTRQQEQVLAAAEILSFRKKDLVFNQGERDNWAFYLLSGDLEMWSSGQLVKKITGGEATSFQPLAQLQPRQMSAVALSTAQVLRVDRSLVDRLLSLGQDEIPAAQIEVAEYESDSADWLGSLLQSPLFTQIPPSNIQRLIDTLETVPFQAGDVVVQQGAVGDYYYIIQAGNCEVCRVTSLGKEIRLAELGPGDTFGEEALISNAKRNATVRMLTPGSLGRLTQENFIELIRKPLLHAVDLASADTQIAAGARWLDVRFPEEHVANGKPNSINVPLSFLRARLKELARDQRYVVYCDTGGRSSAAAFLLMQAGYEVTYVANGAIDEVGAPGAKATVTPPPPVSTPFVAAEARVQSLAADVAKTSIQIETAKRMMADATVAKQGADRYIALRLEQEKIRLEQQATAVRAKLVEAQRLKAALEQQHAAAREEAARFSVAREAKAAELQRRIELTLQEKEQRLEAVYREQTQRVEALQAEHAVAREALQQARQTVELESSMSRERLAAAQRLEQDAQAREATHAAELAAREAELHESFKAELSRERQRFEAEFVKFAHDIAQAQQERQATEMARQAAVAESDRIIAEYQTQHQQQLTDLQQRLNAERVAIAAEASQLRANIQAAITAKEVAELARDRALGSLHEAQSRHTSGTPISAHELSTLEARAANATHALAAALDETKLAESRQRDNASRLAQSYAAESDISSLVRQDLENWVEEQANRLNVTDAPEELAQTARIRARAMAELDEVALNSGNP